MYYASLPQRKDGCTTDYTEQDGGSAQRLISGGSTMAMQWSAW